MMWTQFEAIRVAILLESIVPQYGCHIALTGGCLYKQGERKDLDILFYRIRQTPQIDINGMFETLSKIGFVKKSGFGWCYKVTFEGKHIDCFFPEEQGEHSSGENEP